MRTSTAIARSAAYPPEAEVKGVFFVFLMFRVVFSAYCVIAVRGDSITHLRNILDHLLTVYVPDAVTTASHTASDRPSRAVVEN